MPSTSPALTTYKSRTDLSKYGDNGLLLFALQMGLAVEDIDSVAALALTDGSDDKKCDLVYVDLTNGRAIIAQGYISTKAKASAPANKASDLNTAAAWLLGADERQLPERLRPARNELHESLRTGQVRRLEVWYVHNLPESANVQQELDRAAATARALLRERYPDNVLDDVVAVEVGVATLDRWYATSQIPILVTDEITVPASAGFSETGDAWNAFCTSVPASWLTEMFEKYGTNLFSANVRDYLGSINSDANINNNIKQTAEITPGRFFAYNNGLTILVNDLAPPASTDISFIIRGMSIVNGAQTTGALASSKASSKALGEARVLTRFVKCADQRVIREIIQYNNSQNKIEAADFRSNDKIQERLRQEFSLIPDAEYRGGRRGSEKDVIERRPNLIPTQTAAQAIAAFHGQPNIAYNETRRIWSSDEVYSQTFPEFITARHVLFCYSLLKAIEEAKFDLTKTPSNQRTKLQTTQVDFLRKRGSTFLVATAVSSCLETILDRPIVDSWRLMFSANLSPRDAVAKWQPVLLPLLSFVDQLEDALTGYLKNHEKTASSLARFQQLVHATRDVVGEGAFAEFRSAITDSSM
ncbi:AIPR family protein [Nonomuraea sp. SYSU D8015]|uniref:AIPR family protein n=1 Tax=Nonomuraea sp. SYSU D8015 TaxID=2593644 RepID=UPI001660BCEF|nr:AIPR family protein [Nonomuraea sp. SYSU D8015]